MDKEIHELVWRKVIPQHRNQIQAQLLAGVIGTILAALIAWTLMLAYTITPPSRAFRLSSVSISIAFAVAVWMLKAATPVAAACGGMICLLLTYWTSRDLESLAHTALTPLCTLFLLTFLATRAGRRHKSPTGLAEERRGRSAAQIIANLSAAALSVTPLVSVAIHKSIGFDCVAQTHLWIPSTLMEIMCLAALAEATADTVSSEIGQAFGGDPITILGLQRVEPGTDGAITSLGTLSGLAAAALVAVAGAWAMHLHTRETIVAAAAATCGMFFDSFLGATAERRGWLGNDLVNFISNVVAASLAAILFRHPIF